MRGTPPLMSGAARLIRGRRWTSGPIYEAGHAVAAIALGTPVKCVSLDKVTTLVRVGCPRAQYHEAVIALSGAAAETRYCGYSLEEQAKLWGGVWRIDLDNALHRLQAGDSLGEAVREAREPVRLAPQDRDRDGAR